MKIIITGASGFVGQNLSAYLKSKGDELESLSLRKNDWQLNPNTDAIIHLAGKAHDTKNTADEAEYFAINTELTKQLFDKFLISDIKDFIYFSSVKAAADTVEGMLDEEHSPNPQTAYGKSKLAAEAYLLSKELPEGKRLIILRPSMIHGKGNKGNLNLLYKVVKVRIPWILAAFHNQRSFLSIDNLNFIVHSVLHDSNVPSGVYNITDDESISTNQLIKIIAEGVKISPTLVPIPKFIINTVAKVGDKAKLPLNTERLQKLTDSYVVSNQKIKQALAIDKLPFSAADGLRQTIQSFNQ